MSFVHAAGGGRFDQAAVVHYRVVEPEAAGEVVALEVVSGQNAAGDIAAQAVLQGLKPCMIGIILATGVYMTLHNCFPLAQGAKVDFRALLIVMLLVACMSMYRILKKKKLSPILLIIASAALGILIY